jgi:hypothetical protein
MKLFFAHSKHFDYQLELYQPLRESPLNSQHEILLPHDPPDKDQNSRVEIANCDIIFAEVSLPGTGLGMCLGWADAAKKPIVCLYRTGSQVSNSLQYITDTFIEYTDSKDFIEKVTKYLASKS